MEYARRTGLRHLSVWWRMSRLSSWIGRMSNTLSKDISWRAVSLLSSHLNNLALTAVPTRNMDALELRSAQQCTNMYTPYETTYPHRPGRIILKLAQTKLWTGARIRLMLFQRPFVMMRMMCRAVLLNPNDSTNWAAWDTFTTEKYRTRFDCIILIDK